MSRPLTRKQTIFASEYNANGGNGTQAAKVAYFKEGRNDNLYARIATNNIRNLQIKAIIAAKTAEITKNNEIKIKSRLDRQAFWSSMMDTAGADADKLRASELLGKSEADFDHDHDQTQVVVVQQVTAAAEVELLRARLARLEAMAGAEDGIQRG